jgi:hypothetical protein
MNEVLAIVPVYEDGVNANVVELYSELPSVEGYEIITYEGLKAAKIEQAQKHGFAIASPVLVRRISNSRWQPGKLPKPRPYRGEVRGKPYRTYKELAGNGRVGRGDPRRLSEP